jgi:hypothetical protein
VHDPATDDGTADLSPEQWEQLDALILIRHIIPALKLLREWLGVGLREAMEIHLARYRQLRDEHPDDFSCTDEEYWAGVYS